MKISFVLRIVLIFVLSLISIHSIAQNTAWVQGKVFDKKTAEAIPGVTVKVSDNQGTVTDIEGGFKLELPAGDYMLEFSFMGYKTEKMKVKLLENRSKSLVVELSEDVMLLQMAVISGSAYEKNLAEETVSIDVLQPEVIKNTNPLDMTEALEKVPGVKITDGQASIRGGSSYSYGAGSRVQVLVDGQSYITADLSEVRWKFIPIGSTERVEVIKGASSVLYGSSSMNGVINIITGWPGQKPIKNFSFYQGFYFYPQRKEMAWWEWSENNDGIFLPNFSGMEFDYREKFGQFDVIVGGRGTMLNSYIQGIDETKGGLNFKTRYRHPDKNLTIGLNGNFLYERNARFLLFKDADTGAMQTLDGHHSISSDNYILTTLNPNLTYFNKEGNRHKVDIMLFKVSDVESDKIKDANVLNYSYQYQHHFWKNAVITSGYNGSFGWMDNADLYEGVKPRTYVNAIYGQAEKKFGRLSLVAGLRLETNTLGNLEDADTTVYGKLSSITEFSGPIFRTGLNYQLDKHTFLRASYGQAYRFPSIAERFLDQSHSVITIFPNPELRSESGWSSEIGLKQGISIGNWNGYADVALFWMEYDNFITYVFGVHGDNDPPTLDDIGFKPFNVDRVRVAGYEFTLMGEGNLGRIPFRVIGGYTFDHPVDLGADSSLQNPGKYLQSMVNNFSKLDSIGTVSVLPYRNRHSARIDMEADLGSFSLGMSYNYSSPVEQIDEFFRSPLFSAIIPGIDEYTERYNRGFTVVDFRVSYTMKSEARIALIFKNAFNEELSPRPGIIGPPRNLAVQVRVPL